MFDITEQLTPQQLMTRDLYNLSAIEFAFYENGYIVPFTMGGKEPLEYEEWEMLIDGVQEFYHGVPRDFVQKQREWLQYKESMKIRRGQNATQPEKKRRIIPGWVYILRAGPFYKIGKTKNVNKRVKQLSALPPFDLKIIHKIKTEDMEALELDLHGQFADKRKRGEWFELDEEDVAWLKTL